MSEQSLTHVVFGETRLFCLANWRRSPLNDWNLLRYSVSMVTARRDDVTCSDALGIMKLFKDDKNGQEQTRENGLSVVEEALNKIPHYK